MFIQHILITVADVIVESQTNFGSIPWFLFLDFLCSDAEPLLSSDHVFENMALDVEQLLTQVIISSKITKSLPTWFSLRLYQYIFYV